MSASPQTQAILLLTVAFAKPAPRDPEPLTPAEWGRFASWLKSQEKSPELLLTSDDPVTFLQGWSDPAVTPERIRHLLARSGAMGLALEKWQRAGLWVMTRADPDYPIRLKKRLKLEAPPVLFGCGDRGLLNRAGIAVVGSQAADEEALLDASKIAAEIASQGFSVVSGGARGVDEAAMLSALESQGTAAGVLADSLLRAATSAKYRQGLMSRSLVLVSPFSPEAGPDAGHAMARDKYIYCLADAAVVVNAGMESGAIENLKHGWVPLWVKEHVDPDSGNAALVRQGARWLPGGELVVASLASPTQPENPDGVRLQE